MILIIMAVKKPLPPFRNLTLSNLGRKRRGLGSKVAFVDKVKKAEAD